MYFYLLFIFRFNRFLLFFLHFLFFFKYTPSFLLISLDIILQSKLLPYIFFVFLLYFLQKSCILKLNIKK